MWAALTAANLSEVAASEGPFTLFAPTNDAFAKVAKWQALDVESGSQPSSTTIRRSYKTKTMSKIPEETITNLLADPEALSVILLRSETIG